MASYELFVKLRLKFESVLRMHSDSIVIRERSKRRARLDGKTEIYFRLPIDNTYIALYIGYVLDNLKLKPEPHTEGMI